jgi:DNA-binding NarL/FixJ family response regulator
MSSDPALKKPVRIVIADDHELVRQGMRAILATVPGWTVCGEAANGRDALALALELQPDLLVLDLSLPEMNGIEVTRQVRRASAVAVLIVSMHDVDQSVQEAIAAGASGYVLKADAGRTLVDAIRTVLSHGEFFSERLSVVDGRKAEPAPENGAWKARLTSRELEVLQLLAEGLANKEIAAKLSISPKTAETHRARIMAKLEFHSVTDLVRYAVRNHIIEA